MRYEIDGFFMSGNDAVAQIKDGLLLPLDPAKLPFYLQRCNDLYGWLERRAVDKHRTNSRLLKRLARITQADDPDVAMKVYGATITDNFWVKPAGSDLAYEQVRFFANPFADTALFGSLAPFSDGSWANESASPELTNIGSFEKCWKKEDGSWWLYKKGDEDAQFAELFMCQLGKAMGLSVAEYVLSNNYVKSKDVSNDATFNLDHAFGLVGEDYEDYSLNYEAFSAFSPNIAEDYVKMLYFDALCRNVDRHTENYALLRDSSSGTVVSMAPLFDHNIALFCKDCGPVPTQVSYDLLMHDFCDFIKTAHIAFNQPIIEEASLREIAQSVPIPYDTEKVVSFILGRQRALEQSLSLCPGYSNHICCGDASTLYENIDAAFVDAPEINGNDEHKFLNTEPR